MKQLNYNNLTFKYQIKFYSSKYLFSCPIPDKMENDIISFLLKIEEFKQIVRTTIDQIIKSTIRTGQTTKSIIMNITVNPEQVCSTEFIVLTEEMAEKEYKYLNKISFTSFYYKKDIQMLGYKLQQDLELKEKYENDRRSKLETKHRIRSAIYFIASLIILIVIIAIALRLLITKYPGNSMGKLDKDNHSGKQTECLSLYP